MPSKSFLFTQEPDWSGYRSSFNHKLPPAVQSWVYESHSLTQRLRDWYGDGVSVDILFHQWHPPFLSEWRQLKSPANRACLIREVLLHTDGKPLILARTIIPAKTIKAAKRNLNHLGNRPLGEIIFSYPKLKRLDMNIACVAPENWNKEVIQRAKIDQPIWGRRTVYSIRQRPMLVSEFFLPEILNHA